MDTDKIEAALQTAVALGFMSAEQANAGIAELRDRNGSFGAGEDFGAIDWAKLLETLKTLLPVIVQLLPVIIALFQPKQPPVVGPDVPAIK